MGFLADEIIAYNQQRDVNHLLLVLWSGFMCNLFESKNTVNFFTLNNTMNEMSIDEVLRAVENQCHLQIILPFTNHNWTSTESINRDGQIDCIIYAVNLDDAWIILESIWKTSLSARGEESIYLILMPPKREDSNTVQFVRRAWTELYYFTVLIADALLYLDRPSFYLNVLADNPYYVPTSGIETSCQHFAFTENSTNLDYNNLRRFLESRTSNLNGYPVRITMHAFKGLSEPVFDQTGKKIVHFEGTEGNLIKEQAKFLNYTPIYNLPRDGIVYGGDMENGSFTGGFRDVEDGVADIFGNRRKVVLHKSLNCQYLRTTYMANLVIVVPTAIPKVKLIGTLLSILDKNVYLLSIALIVIVIIIWAAIKLHKSVKYFNVSTLIESLLDAIGTSVCIINNISTKFPKNNTERIIFASLSIWALTITNIYIGTITTRLAVWENSEIDTLEEFVESGLRVGCMKDALIDILSITDTTNNGSVKQRLSKKVFLFYDPIGIPERVANGRDVASLCPQYIADTIVEETLSNDGTPRLHVVREKLNMMFSAQVIRAGFPLRKGLERINIFLIESGLIPHWEDSLKFKFLIQRIRKYENRSSIVTHSPLIMANFRFTFTLWGSLLLISIVVFSLEVLRGQFTRS